LPFITADASGPKHLQMRLTRAKLEQVTADLIERSITPCKRAFEDAKLSVGDINEVVLVGGMTRMPAVQEAVRKFFGREPHKGVNPDEVVGVGAAIQGGVLGGEVKDILLLDVTPLTLSIETLGGVATALIERNTTIPYRKSQIFSTASDMQTSVEINVTQGERPMAADNKTLGRFILDGIPPAPRGVPQIEVTFDIDANGILNVSAEDKATGRKQHITITASSGLSKEEVEKMVQDGKKFEAEDKKRRERIEAKNQADTLVYQAEKLIREQGDKISAVKSDLESKISALKGVLDTASTDELQRKTRELADVLQKAGAAMYEQPGAAEGATPPPGSGPAGPGQSGEDVVDGEYTKQ
jgi:molecular chaperone DnaK